MGSKKAKPHASKAILPFKVSNRLKRQELHVNRKRALESTRRDERFRRKREEDKDPELKRRRLATNIPQTIERKRVWDEIDDDILGASVDVEQLKRHRVEEAEALEQNSMRDVEENKNKNDDDDDDDDDDLDSMLDSEDEDENKENAEKIDDNPSRAASIAPSITPSIAPSVASTNLDLTPSALALKFPTLFSDTPPPASKILITTSLKSTLYHEAELLCTLFPNSNFVPRTSHRYGHKFSLREIAKFASNRQYTSIVLLKEDQKRPTGLTVVHLPSGPTCHFSVANWVEGKKLPGHGNPTNHYPELILNNFRTPLGLLTARIFLTLFPPQPEFQGRQVVTLHNQRDYIFVRRHRYVFRDKRETEKSVIGPDGKPVKGVEDIRTGLQELGPRFTLKLRRIDKGIGRAGSQGTDAVQWQWKAHMEKKRTRFNL